jgi:protein TonB
VTLRLVISEQGEVESIVVVHAVPPGLFDEAALAAFGRARFAPGLRGGIPVRSEVMYEVEFAPLGKGTESSGRTY